jgi:hypothetical protein
MAPERPSAHSRSRLRRNLTAGEGTEERNGERVRRRGRELESWRDEERLSESESEGEKGGKGRDGKQPKWDIKIKEVVWGILFPS